MIILYIALEELMDHRRKAYIHADLEKKLNRLLVRNVCNRDRNEPDRTGFTALYKAAWS